MGNPNEIYPTVPQASAPQAHAPPAYQPTPVGQYNQTAYAPQQIPMQAQPLMTQPVPAPTVNPVIINNQMGTTTGAPKPVCIKPKFRSRSCGCDSKTFWSILIAIILIADIIGGIRRIEKWVEDGGQGNPEDIFPLGIILELICLTLALVGFWIRQHVLIYPMVIFWSVQLVCRILYVVAGILWITGADRTAALLAQGLNYVAVAASFSGLTIETQTDVDDLESFLNATGSVIMVVLGLIWNLLCLCFYGAMVKILWEDAKEIKMHRDKKEVYNKSRNRV